MSNCNLEVFMMICTSVTARTIPLSLSKSVCLAQKYNHTLPKTKQFVITSALIVVDIFVLYM